jgi:hypothetical protein
VVKTRTFVLSSLLLLMFNQAFAQRSAAETKLGTWATYNGFFEFSPKFQLFLETQWRTYEFLSNTENWMIRPYFNYRLNHNNLVGISTEYFSLYSYAEDSQKLANELRIGVQYQNDWHVSKIHLQNRIRYEFRFFDVIPDAQRIRYRLQLAAPLNKNGFKKGGLLFIINNEIFFGIAPELNYNQNRFYTSLGYQFTDNLNLQIGYQNWDRRDGNYHRIHFWLTQHIWFH